MTTPDPPLRGRNLEIFEDALQSVYGDFHVDWLARDAAFVGLVEATARGPFESCSVMFENARCHRGPLGSAWSRAAFLLVACDGSLVVQHHDKTARLDPGDMLLLDSKDGSTFTPLGLSRSVTYSFDRSAIRISNGHPGQRFGVPILCRGRGRLLFQFLQGLSSDDSWAGEDADLATSLLGDLIDGAVEDTLSARVGPRPPVLELMTRWLKANLGHDDISPDVLAQNFAMSRRNLYRLFANEGTTPGRWMLDIRLDEARRRLLCGQGSRGGVGEIAYDLGFEDPGCFSRSFKRKFGIPPSSLMKR